MSDSARTGKEHPVGKMPSEGTTRTRCVAPTSGHGNQRCRRWEGRGEEPGENQALVAGLESPELATAPVYYSVQVG